MKFLVTGVNGFIGSNLAAKLIANDHTVRGLILEGTDESNLDNISDKIEKVYGNITKPETLHSLFEDIDVVVHLAAWVNDWGPKELIMNINYNGSKNVLDASVKAGVKRFIYMSSLTVHGFEGFQNSNEETPYKPCNTYAWAKKRVEDLLNDYFKQEKIETVIVRPGFTIFGPNDRLFSFEAFKRIVDEGKSFPTVNKGKSLMCFSYVENLVCGIHLVSTHPKAAGQTYIISDGPIISFREFLTGLFEACDQKVKLSSFPSWLAIPIAGLLEVFFKIGRSKTGPLIRRYTVRVSSTDLGFVNDKIVKELGYTAPIRLKDAWKLTYQWYQEEITKKKTDTIQ